jgi:Ni/Co efflux regulator RcnB
VTQIEETKVMKKILLSLAAVSALAAAAAPAVAAPQHGERFAPQVSRADVLELRIQRLEDRHQISAREARNLKAQVRATKQLEWRYARDGRLSNSERADLDRRFDRIQADLRHERRDRDYGFNR